MLKMFLDDSGTHTRSPVVGVGGLIGNETQWTVFDIAWKAVLTEPFPGAKRLEKWSSGDCMRGDDEFDGYNQAERDLATRRFRDVITGTGVYSASNMIDRIAWDEIMTARFDDKVSTAEGVALFSLIGRIVPWARQHKDGPEIAIFYDMGRKDRPEIQRLAGLLQDVATAIPGIRSFSFAKVVETTPLQGADMIATESFWFAQDILSGKPEPSRAHFRAYLEENFHRGNGMVLDRGGVERAAAKRNAQGAIVDPNDLDALVGLFS